MRRKASEAVSGFGEEGIILPCDFAVVVNINFICIVPGPEYQMDGSMFFF